MLASMEEALVSSSEQEESITAANDDEGTPKRLHRRSVSCSAIPESVFEGQSSDCSTGSVPGSHHASMAVAAESTADDGQQHRHHKHKHRHHHHHRRHHSQLPQQQRLQYSVSADDLPASGSQGNSGSSTPNLLAALEERPRWEACCINICTASMVDLHTYAAQQHAGRHWVHVISHSCYCMSAVLACSWYLCHT